MKKFIIPTVILFTAFAGLGYFVYKDLSVGTFSEGKEATTTPNGTIMTDADGNKYLVEKEEIPQKPAQNIPAPSLDRVFTPPSTMDAVAAATMTKEYNDVKNTIRANPQALQPWLILGAYRKQAGDYEGAKEVWIYVTKMSPNDVIAYGNLGDLYDFYLKDYKNAELMYRKVVSIKPDNIAGYRSLHSMYLYRYQTDTTKAVDILKEGLVKNPGNTDLLVPLASYYKEKGMKDEARKYYLEARASAQKLGNATLVAQIDEELKGL